MLMKRTALLVCLLVAAPACGAEGGARNGNAARPEQSPTQTPAPAAPAAEVPKSATCALLSAEDVREVLGEAPADAQGSEHFAGALSTSQCFYRLPTFTKSFSLEVVRAAPDALRNHWRKQFRPEAVEAREHERRLREEGERAREEELRREREAGLAREGGRRMKRDKEAEDARPRRVEGLGAEAYWSGNQNTAALSVLGGKAVVRVVVGGPEEDAARIRKASELARRVLKRL